MALLEYVPIDESQEFIYRDSSKGPQLWRKWQQEALTLIEAKVPADEFLRVMTKKIYGINKDIVILDKRDPYIALMNFKEICNDKNFEMNILTKDKRNSNLVVAI